MLIDKKITLRVCPQNIKHLQGLGYNNIKSFDTIEILTSELAPTSKKIEERKCDCCNATYEREHNKNVVTFDAWGKDVCPTCLKSDNFKKLKSEKFKKTMQEKYGVDFPLQYKEFSSKQKQTMIQKYGEASPMHVTSIKEKIKQTNLEKYNSENVMGNSAIKDKVRETLYKNGNCPTSTQQLSVFKMLQNIYRDCKVEINYPFSSLSLDVFIVINNCKIDVEYDGSFWHQDPQKDRRRDEFLKREGFKILRIRSAHLIPEENQLKAVITQLVETNKNFIELILEDWH